MRHLPIAIIAIALLIGGTSAVFAHAHLTKSQPAGGSTLKVAPADVTIWFTEALEPKFVNLQVVDASGNRVDQRQATVDPSDAKVLHVALKPLAPGSYKVAWRVVSVDTHTTNGAFSFAVAP